MPLNFRSKRFTAFACIVSLLGHSATLNPEQSSIGLSDTDSQYKLTPFKTLFTEECLKLNPQTSDTNLDYVLSCPTEQILEKLREDPQPGLQVLVLSLLRSKIIAEREEFRKAALAQFQTGSKTKQFSLWDSFFIRPVPNLQNLNIPELEKSFAGKIQPLVDLAKKIFELPDPVLGFEKYYYYSQILGESFHFTDFISFIQSNSQDDLRHDLVAWSASWYEKFQSSREVLGPWLLQKAQQFRTGQIKDAKTDRELFYWLLSLELLKPDEVQKQKKELLSQLRALWINFPADESAQKIRKTAEVLGLSRDFSPPGMNQMDFGESVLRAQALLKKMDYEGAQKALRRTWAFDSKLVTAEEAYDAFLLHIRVLRFSDQRHKIPDIIERYLSWAPQIYDPNAKNAQLANQIPRGVEIARALWTYVDGDQALQKVQELLELSKKISLTNQIPQLLYLRARIMEQKGNREAALGFFEEALKSPLAQDMKTDLIWRYFYLHFEKATPAATLPQLFSVLDRIKKELPGQDDARVFYWQGKVFTLNLSNEKNKAAAVKQFLRAFESDPFSFYSNLAGLELINLGVTPPQWLNEKYESNTLAPIWAEYVSSDGAPKNKDYLQLARLYHLTKISDRNLALKALGDVDKSVWSYLLSSKKSSGAKSQFGQAMSWLRFSIGDAMGGLRVAEVLRTGLKGKLSEADQALLYPLPYFDKIKQVGTQYKTNPWLAASLIRQESAFNPRAKSFANAIGLMQMIPPVATLEAKRLNMDDFQIEMLYTPDIALKLGVHHLGNLIRSFDGSWICAVASYNAGEPPVKKWIQYYSSSHPIIFIERISYSETRNYVKSILRNYINYQRIYGKGVIQTASLFDLPNPDGAAKQTQPKREMSSRSSQIQGSLNKTF